VSPLTAADLQECLYALYGVRERIDQYRHETYDMHRAALQPIELLIRKVRAERDERKRCQRRGK
jgi:hypothetical protein